MDFRDGSGSRCLAGCAGGLSMSVGLWSLLRGCERRRHRTEGLVRWAGAGCWVVLRDGGSSGSCWLRCWDRSGWVCFRVSGLVGGVRKCRFNMGCCVCGQCGALGGVYRGSVSWMCGVDGDGGNGDVRGGGVARRSRNWRLCRRMICQIISLWERNDVGIYRKRKT